MTRGNKGPNLRILLAEDNVINQKVLQLMLKHMGYPKADVDTNGRRVLQAVEQNNYDIIFMDINMPEPDGLETTKAIRIRCPREKQPKIIALTTYAISFSGKACIERLGWMITSPSP
jgi:CheY-like chemotaxis protein